VLGGGKYRNSTSSSAATARGRLVELNATSGGATGWVEIFRNKGGMTVPRGKGERLINVLYV
jgi:hypothetical protein